MSMTKHPRPSFLSLGLLSATVVLALSTSCKESKESEESEESKEAKQEKTSDELAKAPAQPTTPSTESTGKSDQDVTLVEERSTAPIDDVTATVLIAESREVASEIAAAITAIDANQPDKANVAVTKAIDALAKLKADRPNVDIAIELWQKHHELERVDLQAGVDTVPLFATLTRINVPVRDSREIEARHALRKTQIPSEVSTTEKAKDLEIIDSNLVYLEVDLPIASTEIEVRAAKAALDEGKLTDAKAALTRAQASYEVIAAVAEAPEFQARRMVWAAQKAFVKGDMAEAKRLLTEAGSILAPLTTADDDPQGQLLASILMTEIKPLQAVLETDNAMATNGFQRAERDAMTLARRASLREVMRQRNEAEQVAFSDALMWLETAETAGLFEASSKTAVTENLQRAETALAKASAEAPVSAKPNFDRLRAHIVRLIDLDNATPRNADLFASELRGVTFDVRMLMLDVGVSPAMAKRKATQG